MLTKNDSAPVMIDYGVGRPRPVLKPQGYTLGKNSTDWQQRQKFGGCFLTNVDIGTKHQPTLPKRTSGRPTQIPRDDGFDLV